MSRTIDSQARVVDLHAHTTASDGDHSPTALIAHAAEKCLTVMAVTDHDTTAGVEEALEAGRRYGIEVVPGIELSAEIEKGQCHILGLLIDPNNARLQERLQEVVRNRNTRNGRIIARMQKELNFDIRLEEVEEVAGGEVVARPHFARVLVNKGYVQSMQEAFDVYLGKGGKAYVDRDRLTQEEAIALIHAAGGVAILAHPNNLKRDVTETESIIRALQAKGLDGIEARYNLHTPEENARYLALAEGLGLLTSGGSDFHGPTVKAKVILGHVEGEQPAPYGIVEALKAKAGSTSSARPQ